MLGKILFWLLYPIFWFVIPLTRRTRVIIVQDGKVLAIKNWLSPQDWDLPGGGVKFGESPQDAATREVREELGIACTNVRLLHDEFMIRQRRGLLTRIHFVQADVATDVVIRKNWEIAAYAWLDIDALKDVIPEALLVKLTPLTTSDTL